MTTPLPANVNLTQLLAANPAAALAGTEPFETVQSGTSVAATGNQILSFVQANFSVGNLATIAGLSVLGVAGTAATTVAAITGGTDQVFRVGHNGTTLAFGAVNLATTAAVTGVLPVIDGGMGTASLNAFSVLCAGITATAALQQTSATTAGYPYVANGSASLPSFQALNLASTFVTSVLGTSNGGIGTTTLGQIPGATNTSSASPGNLGEYLDVTSAATSALTTNTTVNVTTISLSPGDWNVNGVVSFNPAANTRVDALAAGISQTSATLPTLGTLACVVVPAGSTTLVANPSVPVGPVRVSVNATTSYFLVARMNFATNTASLNGGEIAARRMR